MFNIGQEPVLRALLAGTAHVLHGEADLFVLHCQGEHIGARFDLHNTEDLDCQPAALSKHDCGQGYPCRYEKKSPRSRVPSRRNGK
jgi:hypothetical protein